MPQTIKELLERVNIFFLRKYSYIFYIENAQVEIKEREAAKSDAIQIKKKGVIVISDSSESERSLTGKILKEKKKKSKMPRRKSELLQSF